MARTQYRIRVERVSNDKLWYKDFVGVEFRVMLWSVKSRDKLYALASSEVKRIQGIPNASRFLEKCDCTLIITKGNTKNSQETPRTIPYLRSEYEFQLPLLEELGIDTKNQTFEQAINCLIKTTLHEQRTMLADAIHEAK